MTSGEASAPTPAITDAQETDTYTINNGDGTVTQAEYDLATLILNTPTEGDFDPTLPVGIIALDEPMARYRLNARVSAVAFDETRRGGAGGGLSIVGSGCSTVWTGTPHDNSNGKMDMCAVWYKPDGDSDPDKNYRMITTNSTSRGGNGAHVLEQATTRNEITQGNICCDWSPNDCCVHPDGGTTVHWSIVLSPGGLGGAFSGDYVFWPDTFGLRYFETAPNDKANYGWRGGAQCCQLFGGDGGVDFNYNQGGNFSFQVVPFIQWHN